MATSAVFLGAMSEFEKEAIASTKKKKNEDAILFLASGGCIGWTQEELV
jgi:hypothetical protein